MAIFVMLFGFCVWLSAIEARSVHPSPSFDRNSFPQGFVFGTASSAFQYEGAVNEGGRGPCIWHNFTNTYPERTRMHKGDIAVDFYHRYKEDIKLMKEMNMDAFRFSISWSRILPGGKLSEGVNKEGIQFYKNLIDELIANDLEPFATIYHWELPQALEDEYGGFLSPKIIDDFRDFARICFEEFGDKVKTWGTFNEPYVFSVAGYDFGKKAVGRCSKWVNEACQAGDSGTEPYLVSHNLLLAHAAAVEEFRKCDKCQQIGKIGIVLSPYWFEPYTDSSADKEAVKRALDFSLGWHLNPLIFGDYPEIMKKYAGNRLPSFSMEQSNMLKNSFDFIGINYYTARYVSHVDEVDSARPRYFNDQHAQWKVEDPNGNPIGPEDGKKIIYSYPQGIRKILNHIKNHYNNPIIYIAENGFDENDDGTMSLEEALNDSMRIEYHEKHLHELHKAIVYDGVDVRGYYAWSLLDNFEWEVGYTARFGLFYVDYNNDLKRYPKNSAKWFEKFLQLQKPEKSSVHNFSSIMLKTPNVRSAFEIPPMSLQCSKEPSDYFINRSYVSSFLFTSEILL